MHHWNRIPCACSPNPSTFRKRAEETDILDCFLDSFLDLTSFFLHSSLHTFSSATRHQKHVGSLLKLSQYGPHSGNLVEMDGPG